MKLLINLNYQSSWFKQAIAGVVGGALLFTAISCRVSATNEEFFGRTVPPERNILRYVNGAEPESLDPAISSGQQEARIYMALYEGLVEYDPKSLDAIPAIAERWDVNNDSSEFVFHLRTNARWSNGEPINAHDFVYSIRRSLTPEVESRSAGLAYPIRYAEAFNAGAVFVRDPASNQFLLEKDFAGDEPAAEALSQRSLRTNEREYEPTAAEPTPDRDTPFHQFMHSPDRLVLPGAEKARHKLLESNPKLQAAVAGKELVKVRAEDVGVEPIDDYTVRISLSESVPYFTELVAHQIFRLVPRRVIEQYGAKWTDAANIVTSGAFKLKSWKSYSEVVVERNPMYWDASSVRLDEIHFYASNDHPTTMNLYKVGSADAVVNHSVPNAW
ncbi:MAG TPA: ABC transporter substrate-binding protein, partial [Pyrinomonadaceae bacterium]|nr:ABC transporter substrate-binding protein [Pyrinomonadaceae bacterium]